MFYLVSSIFQMSKFGAFQKVAILLGYFFQKSSLAQKGKNPMDGGTRDTI